MKKLEKHEAVKEWTVEAISSTYGRYVYEMNSWTLVAGMMEEVEKMCSVNRIYRRRSHRYKQLNLERMIKDKFGSSCLRKEVTDNE